MASDNTPLNTGALRNEWRTAMDEMNAPPAVEPAVEPPPESVPAPAEPPPEAVPAASSEPASPEGSTPAGQQPEAVPDPDREHVLDLVGARDLPEAERLKAYDKWVLDANRRLADLAKENKALKGTPAEPAEPAAPPIQTQPVAVQPTATPTPQPTVTAQTAPVAQDEEALIEQRALAAEETDQQCRAFAAQCDVTSAQIAAYVSRDTKTGQFVGELPTIDAEIASLKARLAPPPEHLKGRLQALDPMEVDLLSDELSKLEFKRLTKVAELRDLRATLKDTKDQWGGRRYDIRQHFRGEHEAQRRDAERMSTIETWAKDYERDFQAEFDLRATAHSITDPADLKELLVNLKAKAHLDLSCFDSPQALKAFLGAGFAAEQGRVDRYHRRKSAEYATKKLADAAQPAPPASAAVAAPLSTQSPDWEKALKANYRQAVTSPR